MAKCCCIIQQKAIDNTLNPSPPLDAGFGFWSSKVFLTAIELEVFTIISA